MSYKYHQATGSGAISETFTPSGAFQVEAVRVHFDTAPAAVSNITISIDHASGAVYDIVLKVDDLNGVKDYLNQFARPHQFISGSSIIVTYANPSARTWGLEVVTA